MKKKCSYNTITATNCQNQRVLLRADLNIPITDTTIDDDFRLQELRPTLDLLLGQQATIVLITHIGRPHRDKNAPVLSTMLITQWLKDKGYQAFFASTIVTARALSAQHPNTIVVLENIRTFPGEMIHDLTFAQKLATLGDCYVNDAFGSLHRNDTSIGLTPLFFSLEKRFIGLLVARELLALEPLKKEVKHPFIIVLGGSKVTDKLPIIEGFLDKADALLLCPALASTFMKAQGIPIGKSLVDEALLPYCKKLMERSVHTRTTIMLPTDLQIAQGSLNGPLSYKKSHQLAPDDISIALGPVSITNYAKKIASARMIFFNAAMGFSDRPETRIAAKTLIEAIDASSAYSVIGGGDSVALANNYIQGSGLVHLSTGGGATLTYLSGAPLPGLDILCSTEEIKK